jgi:hypothetical protein
MQAKSNEQKTEKLLNKISVHRQKRKDKFIANQFQNIQPKHEIISAKNYVKIYIKIHPHKLIKYY